MRIFKKSVYFLFESGSLDSPGGPSSNRRYSITGVLRRRVIMNFTSKGPAEAKSTITLRRIHLIRRPYAKRRGRRETMFDCPLSKTVKILDQRSCSNVVSEKIHGEPLHSWISGAFVSSKRAGSLIRARPQDKIQPAQSSSCVAGTTHYALPIL